MHVTADSKVDPVAAGGLLPANSGTAVKHDVSTHDLWWS